MRDSESRLLRAVLDGGLAPVFGQKGNEKIPVFVHDSNSLRGPARRANHLERLKKLAPMLDGPRIKRCPAGANGEADRFATSKTMKIAIAAG